MTEKPYSYVSKIYNHLMRSVNYKEWADYIFSIYDFMNVQGSSILELASGNSKLSTLLLKRFPKIIVTDLSYEMLKLSNSLGLRKVCCNMAELPFKNKFSFIYSTFDSINYLDNEESVNKLFKNIFYILDDEGCFTFDVSLEKNSIKHEKRLNRKGKVDGLKFIQNSKYDRISKIHQNKFKIKLENGSIVEEIHRQKIYDFEFYFNIIEQHNLYVVHCFNSFTYDDANSESERAQFVVKKRLH